MWTYSQSSGKLSRDGILIGVGYSGLGADKDQPADQDVRDQGPIPQGQWLIGVAYDDRVLGPLAMRLTPGPGTNTFGRSEFFLHGDSLTSPGNASRGCIVLDRNVREAIASWGDTDLTVTA